MTIDMSTDGDKDAACPSLNQVSTRGPSKSDHTDLKQDDKKIRKVSFPDDEDKLVTQYFEPDNPWEHVTPTTHKQLVAEYLRSCEKYHTQPIESIVQQIQELPEAVLKGEARAHRLCLDSCSLHGAAAADAMEALLRRVQFRRLELHDTDMDDDAAEAIFDMIEYYESANILNVIGARHFGIRGWQAFSRLIKKSAQLSELEIRDAPMRSAHPAQEPPHTAALARALRPVTCCLRSLCLTRTSLSGDPLTYLVTVLKVNNSVQELKLGDNNLTSDDAALLASLLNINTSIQLLDLSNNYIQDKGVGHISKAIVKQASHTPPSAASSPLSPHHCPMGGNEARGLVCLVLWNNQLTRICAVHLSNAVKTSQSLCVLNVGRNMLGIEGVQALGGPGALVSLGLQASKLGPEAARAIADLIRSHSTLQRLDLRDNNLGGAGLQIILSAMKENKTLTQIDLDDAAELSSSNTLSVESSTTSSAETAERARLTREIRALCRSNEPTPADRRPHRKISLTCHSAACSLRSPPCEESRRGGRLRSPAPSPAPSPAGSPIPTPPSRFSVTPVPLDRGSSSSESSSPITPTKSSYYPTSRFRVVQVTEAPQIQVHPATSDTGRRASRFSVTRNYDTMYNPKPSVSKSDSYVVKCDISDDVGVRRSDADTNRRIKVTDSDSDSSNGPSTGVSWTAPDKYQYKTEDLSHDETVNKDGGATVVVTDSKLVKTSTDVTDCEKVDVKVEVTVTKIVTENVNVVHDAASKVHADQNTASVGGDRTMGEDSCTVDAATHKYKDSTTMKKIEAIAEDLGNLIQEMGDLSSKTHVVLSKKSDSIDRVVVRNDSTQTDDGSSEQITVSNVKDDISVPASVVRDNVVLKKNKSESSLDSPDLEVSRLMRNRVAGGTLRDSNSSFSESSMESLNNPDMHNLSQIVICKPGSARSDTELDRRKTDTQLSTESSLDSNTSEMTPVNSGQFLNTSLSSNDSVSPIIFGKSKKLHGSLSSLEASVSSLDSARGTAQDKIMVTSTDSGIEYSLRHTSDTRDDSSSNEGTLTHNYNLRETIQRQDLCAIDSQDTMTLPKRTSSLLDMPEHKSKAVDRTRKISWVSPSPSLHVTKPEPEASKQESKLSQHLEKLLSLFQHPIFSRNTCDDEKRSASNTPPRKESSSVTSSFWSWGAGSSAEKMEKDDKLLISDDMDSSPENVTDSTLSERVQVSFIDESFSKKLGSKTPSTDTDNTLSEFQSLPIHCASEISDVSQPEYLDIDKSVDSQPISDNITTLASDSTENNIVQKQLDLSIKGIQRDPGECRTPANCDIANEDLIGKYENPNDFNRNTFDAHGKPSGDDHQTGLYCDNVAKIPDLQADDDNAAVYCNNDNIRDVKENLEVVRPRSFAAVLKSTSGNTLDKPTSPDNGQSIDKLSNKVIRGIKENISPENTLTSSMTNTRALAQELCDESNERKIDCNQQIVNALWEVSIPEFIKIEHNTKQFTGLAEKFKDSKYSNSSVDGTLSQSLIEVEDKNEDCKDTSIDSGVTLEASNEDCDKMDKYTECIDLGRDALAFLVYENQDFEPDADNVGSECDNRSFQKGTVLAEELRDAEMKQQLMDLSPELIIDDVIELPKALAVKDVKEFKLSSILPDRAKLKKSNSLEELSQRLERIDDDEEEGRVRKSRIIFKVPDTGSTPKDIPEPRRHRLRTRSGSSPKSLPECFIKSPSNKSDSLKKKKKVSSLGKIARDSLLALNMSEEEIAEYRRSYKLTSVESLRSLESVSEDANSQSGNSVDSRCRICFRTSQESLMSLDSISEDCRCSSSEICGDTSHSAR